MTITEILQRKNDLEHERTVTGAGTSDPVIFGEKIYTIAVSLNFLSASTAKIQTTLDSTSEVVADTASWDDWPDGDVTVRTIKAADAPTALRVVNTGPGDVVLDVRCNRGSN